MVFKFENHLGGSSFGVGGNFPAKVHVDRGVDRAVDTPEPQVDRAVDLGVDWVQKHNSVFCGLVHLDAVLVWYDGPVTISMA